MSEDYEEMDSFTEAIMKRTQERQRLLSDDMNDRIQVLSELSPNVSQSSLKSDVSVNDNKLNIKLNESQNESIVDSTSKQVIENLSKLSPNRGRVPLNKRLKSIARTYNFDDNENIDFIDENDFTENIRPKNDFNRSPTKSMRQTAITAIESPPKKKLLLNERLNQIARSYDKSNDFVSNFVESKGMPPTIVEDNSKKEKELTGSQSPTKKHIQRYTINEVQPKEPEAEVKTPISRSPIKKQMSKEEEKTTFKSLSPNKSLKTPVKVSPVKKIESNDMKEKLSQFGFEKTEPSVRPKSIYNSGANKKEFPETNGSTNVSEVRKQFEQKFKSVQKVESPEILPLRAKTDLFEKAILAENEAKSKQYNRKRNAPEVKLSVRTNDNQMTNNRAVTPKATISDETAIKRQKSTETIKTKTSVTNNILLRRQELEEKLFGSMAETTTANAYKIELENRQKEIELLKRPFKRNESEEHNNVNQEVDQNQQKQRKESYESVDDETAQRTVFEAFKDIEDYENEFSDNESLKDNLNSTFNSLKSDSKLMFDKKVSVEYESPSKNRLYPQLFTEPNELCSQSYEQEMNPPEKPPRVQETPATNTTPYRTISFYRREQNSAHTTPSDKKDFIKGNVQTVNTIDLAENNRKIQEKIDDLKEMVDKMNTTAGQASAALNLCLERNEFKSSTERVEAEKVLLLSGQKRIVFLNQIQRLKMKLNQSKPEPEASKGLLTLSDLRLRVKGEFVVGRAQGKMPEVHHIICLIDNGANVMASNLLNTDNDIKNGFLEFEFGFRDMNELFSDFQIRVHIYDLITVKHQITHESKYHIKSLKRTPKKNKSTMKSPTVRSPGGPNAVMTTSFRLVGTVAINLKNYDNKCFRLENFDFNSPLEGSLMLKSSLTVRHPFRKNGFFDVRDNSGFWNTRWTVLKGSSLAFWRCPDDMTSKPAITLINLKNCINPKISMVPLHLRRGPCIRKNTLALIFVDNIDASKNIFTKGGSLPRSRPITLLISSENKENCIQWSEYLNTTLSNIRLWDVDAIKPYSEEEFEKLLVSLQ